MSDELKILFPGTDVAVRGETITIKPFKTKQLPQVMGLVAELYPIVAQTKGNMLAVATLGAEQVIKLAVVATGKSREWIDDLELDELLPILMAVLDQNWNFIEKKVKPQLGDLRAMLVARGVVKPATAPAPVDGAPSTQS